MNTLTIYIIFSYIAMLPSATGKYDWADKSVNVKWYHCLFGWLASPIVFPWLIGIRIWAPEKQYEHKIIYGDPSPFKLDLLSKEGWELITVIENVPGNVAYCFKREKI